VIVSAAIPLLAAQADKASAQFVGFYQGPIYPYGVGAWNYPYYGRRSSYGRGWGNRMAGTVLSSNEFGMAQMIRASGYANLQTSQATENTVQARSADLGNRVTWTNDYYQMRQAHRGNDASRDRLSMQDVTRIAHDAAPHDLDADQANPTTGKISWPVILQDARFIEDRDEIENLYRSRANSGKFDAESYLAFNKSCETLLHTLKANIGEFSANDYQQARHFVENLRASAKSAGN
jgi:hypothetical protein